MESALKIFTLSLVVAVVIGGQCEVCEKFLGDHFPLSSRAKDINSQENAIKELCKGFDAETQFYSLCYNLGALEISAATSIRALATELLKGLPENRICDKLGKKDAELCAKLHKAIDLDTIDLKKAKVKELRKIIASWQTSCDDCLEKGDFVRFIEKNRAKYAPKKQEL